MSLTTVISRSIATFFSRLDKLLKDPFLLHQFIVCAGLSHMALVQYQDLIRVDSRYGVMRHTHSRSAFLSKSKDGIQNGLLGKRI
mmetsp:Transcript_66467/g.183619  ORF Transcript_66467/g.183619 Transcript_66467/m.183619 type:complete len:85 (+) Transcript_66467:137-391(+)